MKGLWKYISPFAPDQSGAAAVLYGLGGIVVICDAGGCAGNSCGFDEPRWFSGRKSAVFSAGLRDMDAILGRDDRLIAKLCDAAQQLDAAFAAIIGTPVPAVIGTDYIALQRMAERKLSIPIITINTTGMEWYDKGIEKAYDALMRKFAPQEAAPEKTTVGVLGAVPLELMAADGKEGIDKELRQEGWEHIVWYDSFDDFTHAGSVAANIVVSPAALPAARYVQQKLGIPYETRFFGLTRILPNRDVLRGKRVLIVHQQIAAKEMQNMAEKAGAAYVRTASWFSQDKAYRRDDDVILREEDDWVDLADTNDFDVIIGDSYFKKAIPHFTGMYIDFPHFAVSGRS